MLITWLFACEDPAESAPGDTDTPDDDSAPPAADTAPLDSVDPDTSGTLDTGDTAAPDTAVDDSGVGVEMPWAAEGFFDDPGPMEWAFDIDYESEELWWLLRMATSPDGVTWTPQEEPIAQGLNSLDVLVVGEGIIITALAQSTATRPLTPGTIYGIATTDLVHWGGHEWPVGAVAHPNLVDPSIHFRGDGRLGMAYYSTEFSDDDPAETPGQHEIRRAIWEGDAFIEGDTVAYAEEYLADPVVCVLDGEEWLFVTRGGTSVRVARESGVDGFAEADLWDGQSVPFCRGETDHIDLVAQGLGVTEVPSRANVDASGIEELGVLFPEQIFPEGNCTSPVIAKFREQWLYFCAVDYRTYLGSTEHYDARAQGDKLSRK